MSDLTSRQEEIIRAAIKIISNLGIQNLTIRTISREIGITEGAIYNHFRSKLDILSAILDLFHDNAILLFNKINSLELSDYEKLNEYFNHLCRKIIEDKDYMKVFFSAKYYLDDTSTDKFSLIIQYHREQSLKIIEKAQLDGDIRIDISKEYISFIMYGIIFTGFSRYLTIKNYDLENELTIMWNTTMNLLKQGNLIQINSDIL
ncbi:MAG: hypothetical protein A2287_10510 [Candidatus Melainabacteria bacterium RIFOXYA12_FULL_32_12]|nr:MAG: hypothetical protein A2287_10510 [Candidatus Melainabacteria bacterium RIFOXYA12_FULL_32_12]